MPVILFTCIYYRDKGSLGQGTVFTPVCLCGLCAWSLSRGLFLGVSVLGSIGLGVSEGICLGRVSVQGSLSGGLCPGGLCPGVSVWGSIWLGVSVQEISVWGSICLGGLCPGTCVQGHRYPRRPHQGDPLWAETLLYGEEWTVHILLQCCLVPVTIWLCGRGGFGRKFPKQMTNGSIWFSISLAQMMERESRHSKMALYVTINSLEIFELRLMVMVG